MDKIAEEFLKEYLATHNLNEDSEDGYTFDDFYYTFMIATVKDREDLIKTPRAFFDFIFKNMHLITRDNLSLKDVRDEMKKTVTRQIIDTDAAFRASNVEFGKLVNEIIPSNKLNIYDVGPGSIPATSIIIGEKAKSVTAFDPKIVIPKHTLSNMNVTRINDIFTKQTSLENADMIVGKYPCNAIIQMVQNCASTNTPYLIKMCSHNLPTKDQLKLNQNWIDCWRDFLITIDEYARFYDEYVYNLNISDAELKKLIDAHEALVPVTQKQSRKAPPLRISSATLAQINKDLEFEKQRQ